MIKKLLLIIVSIAILTAEIKGDDKQRFFNLVEKAQNFVVVGLGKSQISFDKYMRNSSPFLVLGSNIDFIFNQTKLNETQKRKVFVLGQRVIQNIDNLEVLNDLKSFVVETTGFITNKSFEKSKNSFGDALVTLFKTRSSDILNAQCLHSLMDGTFFIKWLKLNSEVFINSLQISDFQRESILNLENQLLDGKIDLESRKFLVTSIIAGLSGEDDHTIYEANDPFEESIDRLVEVFLKVLVESNSVHVPTFKNETYQQNMRENLIQFIELGDLSSLAFNIYRDNINLFEKYNRFATLSVKKLFKKYLEEFYVQIEPHRSLFSIGLAFMNFIAFKAQYYWRVAILMAQALTFDAYDEIFQN